MCAVGELAQDAAVLQQAAGSGDQQPAGDEQLRAHAHTELDRIVGETLKLVRPPEYAHELPALQLHTRTAEQELETAMLIQQSRMHDSISRCICAVCQRRRTLSEMHDEQLTELAQL